MLSGSAAGQLAARFSALDAAIAEFKMGLGKAWQQTVLMVVTEFGRTVAPNGTRGTDHGVGSVAFVMGGAIDGGKALGELLVHSVGSISNHDVRASWGFPPDVYRHVTSIAKKWSNTSRPG